MSNYKAEFEGLKRLTEFYTKFSTLPLVEEKTLVSLFRIFLSFDSQYEELNALQIQKAKIDEDNLEQNQKKQNNTYKRNGYWTI